jgi:pimeloyl-ACP methyl ester carboxylesterase
MSIADTPVSHRLRRHISVTVLGAACFIAAACANDPTSSATDHTSTAPTTAVTSTTSTVLPKPTSPTTPPPTTAPETPSTTARADDRPTAVLDELVDVDGTRMHVRCVGRGAATVLLISGFEAGSGAWAAVEPAIAARTRVCTYDRPGTGTSDPASAIATFTRQADDLRELLTAVGEPGPYVVVGHSFGGAQSVSFASAFPDDVIGLVLVDASPATWPEALCAVADDGSDAATIVRGLCVRWSEPTSNAEHLDVLAAFNDVATITTLGSLPMAVISAVDRQLPAGLATDEVERLTDAWDQGQRQWSQLSTGSHVVTVEDSSHDIQLDHPDVVIDQVVRLLP